MVGATERILIMAGGTGGHVFPALAVASYLQTQGVEVHWLGTRAGLEARVVTAAGFPIRYIAISGLRGKGPLSLLLAPFKLVVAVAQALALCLKLRPHVVLGMGGFVTGPGGLACWLLRRPLLIHEQNAIPGLTNRVLSHLARQVMEAFPGSFAPNKKVICTGNPVREDISAVAAPEARFKERQGPIRILVVGGSLGALALNQQVPAALQHVHNEFEFEVLHQTGQGKLDATQQAYAEAGIKADTVMFIENMAEAYSWADIVICRAGALTVSELAAVGVASILVPYPHAVDDHQTANARYLEHADAARIIAQNALTPESLSSCLKELCRQGREKLYAMATNARQLAMPQATRQVAMLCQEVMHG